MDLVSDEQQILSQVLFDIEKYLNTEKLINNCHILKFIFKNKSLKCYLLQQISKNAHINILKYLVEEKIFDIHTDYNIVLLDAIFYNNLNIVKYLVKHGVNIHIYNDQPIRDAVFFGRLKAVKYLEKRIIKKHYLLKLSNKIILIKI